jgi:hypothetical protein
VPAVVGTATMGAMADASARPPVADILEVPHGAGLAGLEGDRLAGVERAAAADGDDAVMPARAIDGDAVVDVPPLRVRLDLREERGRQAALLQQFHDLGQQRQLREAGVGDDQRARDAGRAAGVGQFLQASDAEPDGGRVAPVGAEMAIGVGRGGHRRRSQMISK